MSVDEAASTFVTETPALRRRAIKLGGEAQQLTAFLRELRPGDIVWDVGAFVGMYSLFAAKAVGPTGQVYAFEPEPDTTDLLQRNCALNGAANVSIVAAALSDTNGEGLIYAAQEGASAVHSLRPGDSLRPVGLPVQLWRGDTLVSRSQVQAPHVLKVDVEGAELLVLQGLRDTLASPDCRFLFLELHHHVLPRFGARPDDVLAFLTAAGFELRESIQRGRESHVFCHKRH